MHYFQNISSASGGFTHSPVDPTETLPLDLSGGVRPPKLLICPALKNPSGAHLRRAKYRL